jgi:uncharacterized metal-binding protein
MADESELLKDLVENLWLSLRHVFNTDRILLGVTYIINFAGFVLLLSIAKLVSVATAVTLAALLVLNWLVIQSLQNSRRETLQLIATLVQVYEDHSLGKYFDRSKADYYSRRYALWTALAPVLLACAVAIAFSIRLSK